MRGEGGEMDEGPRYLDRVYREGLVSYDLYYWIVRKELRGRSTTVQGSETQGKGVNKSHSVERIRKNSMEDMRVRELL